jgi:hypothetical protein
MYYIFSGFPASTTIGYLEINAVIEFVPENDTRELYNPKPAPKDCPRTSEFLEGIYIRFPQLATLS